MAVYLIDGTSYAYRAFYAIRDLTGPHGEPTNAVFGFTKMLMKIIKDHAPTGMAVTFDRPEPTSRHKMYAEYKAHRPPTPDTLIAQLPLIRKAVDLLGIPVYEMAGYESDDILATLAEHAAGRGEDALIVSSDKDMLQSVGGRVMVYDPMKDIFIGPAEVVERYGIGPERVTEYMALVGDSSDNVPGAKGIGEKTARELMAEFPTLDEMLAHPERIKKPRTRELVINSIENIKISKELVTLDSHVPVALGPEATRMSEPRWEELRHMFTELGFTSLLAVIPSQKPLAPATARRAVLAADELRAYVAFVNGAVAFDTETTGVDPMRCEMIGFSLAAEGQDSIYVPVAHAYLGCPAQIDKQAALDIVRPLFKDARIAKAGHNVKYDVLVLRAEGVEVMGPLYDTMIAAYLLSAGRGELSLAAVAMDNIGRTKRSFKDVLGGRDTFASVPIEDATEYGAEDSALAWDLWPVLYEKMASEGLAALYEDIEMPLIRVLVEMESAGMLIDSEGLRAIGREMERELDGLASEIYASAGGEFNINSPKQLADILFERLGLKPVRKTKTGLSTDADVLEELAASHELPARVLTWRTLQKLKGTYVDVLPALVNPRTGRVHTSLNQAVTATGRLSSSDPNLQNIPARGEWGSRIRACFIAPEGASLISADYSQIELRLLAHLSGDAELISAFRHGLDVHTRTAAEIFGVMPAMVDEEMRRVAKTVNFGVIYGMSAFGLSESLRIGRKEAERYIAKFFEAHPGVSAWIARTIDDAAKAGYVTTMFGRRRPVPELRSANRATKQLGERLAVNTVVQGSAADVIKIAMCRLSAELVKHKMATRMILQVHDELLLESPDSERSEAERMLKHEMEGAVALDVPLTVSITTARHW